MFALLTNAISCGIIISRDTGTALFRHPCLNICIFKGVSHVQSCKTQRQNRRFQYIENQRCHKKGIRCAGKRIQSEYNRPARTPCNGGFWTENKKRSHWCWGHPGLRRIRSRSGRVCRCRKSIHSLSPPARKDEKNEIHHPWLQGTGQQICQKHRLACQGKLNRDLLCRRPYSS